MHVSLSLGKRIRELRTKLGISQVELAHGICTPSMVSQIESDRARPSYKILYSLAERLDVPLEKLLVDTDMNLSYVSTYKIARALVSAKQYYAAIPFLQDLLETPRTQIPTQEILYELAECHMHNGKLDDAEQMLSQVQELAVLRRDHLMIAMVRKSYGYIECQRKRFKLAIYQWQKALEELGKLVEQDTMLQAQILYKIGLAYAEMGQMDNALEHYGQASAIYKGIESFEEVGNLYVTLGLTYKKHHDYEKAAEYSGRAVAIFDALAHVMETLQLQVHRAVLYSRSGRVEESVDMLQTVIGKYRELRKPEEEGITLVELAKIRQQQGAVEVAEALCMQATKLLPESHVYQGWINRIVGRVALSRKERAEAIEQFERAATCFRIREEFKEWDHTMTELADLYHAERDLVRACKILKEVRLHSWNLLKKRGIVL
ncbi:MAG: helix-turn-helix domain-containing protein [Tumebacillaceae bacterium]